MSVILVKKYKDKIIIGADAQETSNNNQKEIINLSKLREVEPEIYIAGAGDGHICSLLYTYAEKNSLTEVMSAWSLVEYFKNFQEWITNEIYCEAENNKNLLERCQFVIICNKRVWQFTDFYVRELEIDEYTSVGCGSQAALACMSLNISIEEALTAVCKVDSFCSLPINIFEIKL